MKQLQKEEVFDWFRTLSGAKRIELMCGLIHLCIPLETRFFGTILEDINKKNENTFREAEILANTYTELEMVCKCDLLLEKLGLDYCENENMSSNATNEMNGTMTTSSNNSNANTNSNSNSGNQNEASNNGTSITQNKCTGGDLSPAISNYPSRSKLIISLCFMTPINKPCSAIVFNSIKTQLTYQNIEQVLYHYFIPKCPHQINELFSELFLLMTMAMYHPAFTYEQRDLLERQKKELENLYSLFLFSPPCFPQPAALQIPIAASAAATPIAGASVVPSSTTTATSVMISSTSTTTSGQQTPIYHVQTTNSPNLTNPSGQAQQQPSQPAPPTHHHHHTQATGHHQFPHHTYHQSSGNKSAHQNVAGGGGGPGHIVAPAQAFPSISNSFIPPPLAPTNLNIQTNSLIQSMAMLKMKPQQSSQATTSPSISPSSNKNVSTSTATGQAPPPFPIPVYTAPPNQLITNFDSENAAILQPTLIVRTGDDKAAPASCYNCGNLGHLGGECTSGDDNH